MEEKVLVTTQATKKEDRHSPSKQHQSLPLQVHDTSRPFPPTPTPGPRQILLPWADWEYERNEGFRIIRPAMCRIISSRQHGVEDLCCQTLVVYFHIYDLDTIVDDCEYCFLCLSIADPALHFYMNC
jgi:hypothetical protein